MNRHERRKAESVGRKIARMKPADRELAIQTGMELQDALAEQHKEEVRSEARSIVKREWALKRKELVKKISAEQADRYAERLAESNRKARQYQTDLVRWRQAYFATYLAWFASAGRSVPQGRFTSKEAIEAAADDFNDQLTIIESRVEKDASHFDRPELLYGVLRWLATTYRGTKLGASCPDLLDSCQRACGFWYSPHQSEVTMGKYSSDYEITWRDKKVKLREHVGVGTSRDPRHTIRVAFFFDDSSKMVVVGYIGLHQQNRAT